MTKTALLLMAAVSAPAAKSDVILLDFTASYCGPCRQMSPVIERMKEQGYPVRKIDITAQPSIARKYAVERIPTFLLLVRGREVKRMEGIVSESRLKNLILSASRDLRRERQETLAREERAHREEQAKRAEPAAEKPKSGLRIPLISRLMGHGKKSEPPKVPAKDAVIRANLEEPQDELALADSGRNDTPVERAVSNPTGTPDPMACSVRIRVKDGERINSGSGTIIENQPGRTLILTCGHVIDKLSSQAQLEVDVFVNGRSETFAGRPLQYDMDADVGLIEIRTMRRLPVARFAAGRDDAGEGDRLFSIGCSLGELPTRMNVKLTRLNRYLGPDNIECTMVPAHGRSGGGLFTWDGLLLGVCSAADHEEQRGLYAGRRAVQDFLVKHDLGRLLGVKPAIQAPVQDAAEEATEPPVPDSNAIAVASAEVDAPQRVRMYDEALEGIKDAEVTCVIRPRSAGQRSRVVVINRATSRFVKWLEGELDSQPTPAMHTVTVGRQPLHDDITRPIPTQPQPVPASLRTSGGHSIAIAAPTANTPRVIHGTSTPRRYRRSTASKF